MLFWRVKPVDEVLANADRVKLTRSLSALQLTMFGVGTIIGTGIFVLTADAAAKAGPAMMISFVIAAVVCGLTALVYAELAAMVPVSGSAYTYAYTTLGEPLAWLVGWALVLEYAIAASAVSVGWSGYMVGFAEAAMAVDVPITLVRGPFDPTPGLINLPALLVALAVTALLIVGTKESARLSIVLVGIKLAVLALFLALSLPAMQISNFEPFMPNGFLATQMGGGSGESVTVGVTAAAASIFFAYVGFDAVSTAAEETKNPSRTLPIGLIGSLVICTTIYILIAAGAVGAVGAQPGGELSRSAEPLAFVLRRLGHPGVGQLLGFAAAIALPSVILMMLFAQTRIFFVMARDGLLPAMFSRTHPRFNTPHVVTLWTGIFVAGLAALFPVGRLAEVSNTGTLFAFFTVSVGVLVLRAKQPERNRPFRTPAVWLVAPLAAIGCVFLFSQLSAAAMLTFLGWGFAGFIIYLCYGTRHSLLARAANSHAPG